jgi:hypothetical protein
MTTDIKKYVPSIGLLTEEDRGARRLIDSLDERVNTSDYRR